MSLAALEALIAHEQALIAALDGNDVGAIERATDAFRGALDDLGAAEPMRDAALKPKLGEAMALADAARTRVAFLADATRRRIDRLAAATGRAPVPVYGSNGRLR